VPILFCISLLPNSLPSPVEGLHERLQTRRKHTRSRARNEKAQAEVKKGVTAETRTEIKREKAKEK